MLHLTQKDLPNNKIDAISKKVTVLKHRVLKDYA